MTNRTKAADMALNRNVRGRVDEDEICRLGFHEEGEAAPLERIATQRPMASRLQRSPTRLTARSCKEGS